MARSVTYGWRLALACAAVALFLGLPIAALAASPEPSAAGGDTRSAGEGPGLVGDPLFALVVVVLVAAMAIATTLVYIRLTRAAHDRGHRD
ncbi:MAG: hypothetical protein AABZ33_03910 [Chloroflexota bacterium]